jgi:hypothetical protein
MKAKEFVYRKLIGGIDFEGAGSFPKKQLKILQAWVELHKDELQGNWKVYQEEGTWFKIYSIGKI